MARGVTSTEYALAVLVTLTAAILGVRSLGFETERSLNETTLALSLSNTTLYVDDDVYQGGSSEGTGVIESGDCTFIGESVGCKSDVADPL